MLRCSRAATSTASDPAEKPGSEVRCVGASTSAPSSPRVRVVSRGRLRSDSASLLQSRSDGGALLRRLWG
eukprot:6483288-Alexandrium_andersonii.AAC.1